MSQGLCDWLLALSPPLSYQLERLLAPTIESLKCSAVVGRGESVHKCVRSEGEVY